MSVEDPRETFERRLVRDMLGAERVRARLLFAIATIALFALVVVGGAYPDAVAALLHGRIDTAPVGLFLIVVAGFELYVLFWIRGLLTRDEAPKTGRRYDHAFVETSMPTAVILYYATGDGPVHALLMPSAFMYSIFILLSTLGLDFFLSAFTGFVAAGEYALIAFLWASSDTRVVEPALSSVPHHLGKAMVLLVSGVAAGFVARRLRRSFTSAIESVGERARIVSVFGQHVSPEVVDYLNDVFEATIDAVVSRHGIVNKFLGDGYMAVFGAPIHEDNASRAGVDAALDIVARVEKLVADGTIPPTQVGIGLHTGDAVVGNIGSAQRREYTVIGDVVNVASRIESLNKELHSRVLVSDETWSASGRDDVEAVPHEAIQVRGRQQAVRIWQLA